MEGHPHPGQAKVLLVLLEEWLSLLLLQACQEELQGLDGQRVLELKEDELKRPGQALMGKSRVGPGDSVSARGWPDSV